MQPATTQGTHKHVIGAMLLIATSAEAMTLRKVPIEELAREADVVAIVEVLKGIQTDCGVRYHGRVDVAIKGAKPMSEIEFGPYSGREIGSRYMVFLTKGRSSFNPVASTNSEEEEHEAERGKRCAGRQAPLAIMFEGFGTFPIKQLAEHDFANAVVVPTEWVGLPSHLATTSQPREIGSMDGKYVSVGETSLVDAVRAALGAKSASPSESN